MKKLIIAGTLCGILLAAQPQVLSAGQNTPNDNTQNQYRSGLKPSDSYVQGNPTGIQEGEEIGMYVLRNMFQFKGSVDEGLLDPDTKALLDSYNK
jgi:hypothetical protein